jgi:hypothetical protein
MSASDDSTSKDDQSDAPAKKKGLNNLTKILIGLGAIIMVVGLIRWIYVRQANKQTVYWS